MSGVSVVWYLLKTNSPVLAVIPATRIVSGDLPLNTVLPAISVMQISSIPYNLIRINQANKVHTDRVQVSALFKGPQGSPAGTGYPGVKAMMRLILAACPNQRGTVNSISVDSITPLGGGPDLFDDATALYSASYDFSVKWIGT